jgi:starch synthase (maltosyl-transferring)
VGKVGSEDAQGINDTMISRQPPEPIVITNVRPELDCGRYAVKREIGDWLLVSSDIFRDGHDVLASVLLFRPPAAESWSEVRMEDVGNDRWSGAFPLDRIGRWHYTIESWTDRWSTWLRDTRKKLEAGQDVAIEAIEGKHAVAQTLSRIPADDADRAVLDRAFEALENRKSLEQRLEILSDPVLEAAMGRHPDRSRAARYAKELCVIVDRERARFAAWYELFPRSQSTELGVHGTFADVERRLDSIAEMGFDVLYLSPIHPIGKTHRKGRNNDPQASEEDVGSPWAIGSGEGGHSSVHPGLGTLEDFRRLVASTRERGMEIALDFAVQASPDHPWIAEHPEWFSFRPDGSIKHAENPPKKYQDIVNFDFARGGMPLWVALRDVVLFWVEQGVKTFRVDNPHTKPIPFWEWMIAEVQQRHPDVIFLAEAFTRPKMMWELAKAGFTQSYTYFTWRNTKAELTQYAVELAAVTNEFLRPNFFANTPDILHRYLQTGGRPAFIVRLILAATISSLYGIYSGFELLEDRAHGDSEEYLDSEKYEIRVRDWHAPGNIRDEIRRINAIRNENRALHEFENIRFYPSNDDSVIFYGKVDFHHRNHVFVVVNLDPNAARAPALEFPTGEFGLDPEAFSDVLFGTQLRWSYGRAYTVLDPQHNPAAVFVQNR